MALSRRSFITSTGMGMLGAALFGNSRLMLAAGAEPEIAPMGPGAKYRPRILAAAVRREEEYGMLWPGAVFDGERARADYTRQALHEAGKLGADLAFREQPIHSIEEARAWVAGAQGENPDGLFILLLDRQRHAWPTVRLAAETGIPTVVFSPLGTSFTTNTIDLAERDGLFISCTVDDFSQAAYGLRMLATRARLREMRFLVLRGDERHDTRLGFFGTRLRYIPASDFIAQYRKAGETEQMREMARDYIRGAQRIYGSTEQDVVNGVRSFAAAREMLGQEEGDGITMDCLGGLFSEGISLPCISWARMNDCGVPAACEADLGACVTHALVQFLFERPGFQQDPVPDTGRNMLIGSHCSCPTRLHGFSSEPEPYYISHHHGERDAVPRTMWKEGQRVTVADVMLGEEGETPRMLISAGRVVDNVAVPPAGGCVVAVTVELDGMHRPLAYPGFHQLFFYGDFKRELESYCSLAGIRPLLA